MSGFIDHESFKDLIAGWPELAIALLYKYYYETLVNIAARKTHNRQAAEDIVQDAFVELWRKSKWLGKQKRILVGPYLLTIVRNRAISFYRQTERMGSTASSFLDNLHSGRTSPDWHLIQSDQYEMLRTLVATLPNRQRECVQLRFFQDLSIEGIARRLGISRKAVEKSITIALKKLRKYKSSMS